MTGADSAAGHAALMNATYRHQRWIYDATRRYYLLGRNDTIARLRPPPGGHVLEVACGTGRNLALIERRYSGVTLYGLDISSEMLRSARRRLAGRATLAEADACTFDGAPLFGRAAFDRILLSYSLSMIPDWKAALDRAAAHLAPGGELHVIDFGDQAALPAWFGKGLHGWLQRFHVTPLADLHEALRRSAVRHGCRCEWRPLFRRYAQRGVLVRTAA